jgi:hypothetical protein
MRDFTAQRNESVFFNSNVCGTWPSTEGYRHSFAGDKLGLAPILQQLPQLTAESKATQQNPAIQTRFALG